MATGELLIRFFHLAMASFNHRFSPSLIFFLTLASIPPSAQAFTLSRSSGLQGWTKDELKIHVVTSGCTISDDQLFEAIDEATDLWNHVPTSRLQLIRGNAASVTPSELLSGSADSGYPTPVIICDTDLSTTISSSANSIPAVTAISTNSDSQINYAFILLNSESDSSANISQLSTTKLKLVIAHELGHVFGLGHSGDTSALMYYDATEKSELRLGQDDFDGISFLYPRNEPGQGGMFSCGTVTQTGGPGSPIPFWQGLWSLFISLLVLAGIRRFWIRTGSTYEPT